jgi:hypothetical protein
MTSTWEHALADCEARLDAAAAALDRGVLAAEIAPFSTPSVPGPLPAPLASWAQQLVDRGEELEQRLTSERERIRAELRRLPRMPSAAREARFEAQA